MKKNTLLLGCLMLACSTFAQKNQNHSEISHASERHNGIIRCASMENDSLLRTKHPEMGTWQMNEAFIQQKIKEYKDQYPNGNPKSAVITIPVVVHVIHNGDAIGTGENITDAQILSQIDVLNQDFRRLSGTPGFNSHPDGADTEIEFCMAVVDPSGNPTNGINRVNLGTASFTMNGVETNVKPVTQWDPTQYCNMWSVRFGGADAGTLGYAQFPNNSGLSGLGANNGAANTDGVVGSFSSFGSSDIYPAGTYAAPYDKGRTMTHEVGHWLGLRHIWGDGGCTVDDFCADTPTSDAANYGCPGGHTSCGTTDMIENYMDYTDDDCMNIFTNDQKTRIQTVMSVCPRRMELASSTACTPPVADDAGISAVSNPNGDYCNVTSFDPVVTLQNFGSSTLTSVTISYYIDANTPSTYSWTGSLATGATVDVTLPTMSTTTGAHTFTASTSLPNGNADGTPANDITNTNFSLSTGTEVTLTLNTDCWGYETYWELEDANPTVIYTGGNTSGIPPGGAQAAAATDPGSYGNQLTITENWCLADGCYDFTIYDDWGDGLEGSAAGCAIDGSYSIDETVSGTNLASMLAVNFGNSETQNFCITSPCTNDAGTMNTTAQTICGTGNVTATHNNDETLDTGDAIEYVLHTNGGTSLGTVISTNSTPTFGFLGGMTYGTTYYISAITGDDVAGSVDQADLCLSVAAGTPVTWYDLPTVGAGTDQDVCTGNQATLNGTGAVSYSWDNGVTNGVAFTPSATTTYTVTGTDANGCQNTDQVIVTVNSLPTVNAGTDQTVCSGASVTLNGSGASSFSWDNGVTDGVAFSATSTTTYTVTGTDANGCQNTDQVTVNVNGLPSVSAGSDQGICPGGSVILNGSGAVSYSWDNGVTNGASFSPATTDTYTVTGTDANGCQNSDQVTVTVYSLPTVSAGTNQSICAGSSITLNGSGATSYSWDNGVTNGVSFSPATTNTYTVTGTDGNGCQNTDAVTVVVNAAPTTSGLTETCNGTNTAYTVSFNVSGGTSPYTVTGVSGSFTGSTYTSNNITSGVSYNITVTDNNGCSAPIISGVQNCSCTTNSGTMQTSPALTLCGNGAQTATHNSNEVLDGDDVMEFYLHTASGSSLGTVIATSTAPTFSFNGGMTYGTTYYISAVVGTNDGSGNVDMADACVSIASGTPVTWYDTPTVDAGANQTICQGSPVTVSASGATSYSWTGGITNGVSFNPTATQTYTVTGTDVNGCQDSDQLTINVNTLPSVSAGSDQVICEGEAVTLNGSGANTYNWNNGVSNGVAFNPSVTTTYTVNGTDLNGCVNSDQVTVTVNGNPSVSAGTDQTICDGQSITLSGSGAQSYSWDNGATNGTSFTPASTTTYTVIGTASNGCTGSDQMTVTVNPTPAVDAGSDQSVCDGQTVTLIASNPDNGSLSWDNGITDGLAFTPALGSTTYTVTVNLNGCINSDQVNVNANITPSVDAGVDFERCEGQQVILTAGNPDNATISWDNGVTDGLAFTQNIGTVTYTVTADLGGCTAQDQIDVTVNSSPVISGIVTNDDGTTNGAIDITISGGSGSIANINWDNGATTEDLIDIAAGDYTVTVTDMNGCSVSETFTVLSTVGIESADFNYQVYPNPTSTQLNVYLNGEFEYHLTDVRGRLILKGFATDEVQLNLENFERGMYLLHIFQDSNYQNEKVILK